MIELTPIEESVAGKQLIEMGVKIGELIGDGAEQNQGMAFEIVIDQKDHTPGSRFALATRSLFHASSVPGFGGCKAIRAIRSRFRSS